MDLSTMGILTRCGALKSALPHINSRKSTPICLTLLGMLCYWTMYFSLFWPSNFASFHAGVESLNITSSAEKIRVNLHDTARYVTCQCSFRSVVLMFDFCKVSRRCSLIHRVESLLITPSATYRISDDSFEHAIREYQLQEQDES